MPQYNVDVLIVGAGPVGLFCAYELIRHGLTCRIIDKKSKPSALSMGQSLHRRTLDVFEDCGFIEEVRAYSHAINNAKLYSEGAVVAHLDFSEIDARGDFLIQSPHDKTKAFLQQILEKQNHAVEWDTEITYLTQAPEEITATIKKPNNKIELFNANWLIACDGKQSTVRALLDAPCTLVDHNQTWWHLELEINWDIPPHEMALFMSKKGPMACIPLGGRRYLCVLAHRATDDKAPTWEAFTEEFNIRSKRFAILSQPTLISKKAINTHQMNQYRQDRVFFAGNCAHTHHPVAGYGLNTGIQDVYNLVWKLALVEQGQAQAEILDSYHHERSLAVKSALKQTHAMIELLSPSKRMPLSLHAFKMKLKTSYAPLKKALIHKLAQGAISYKKSPIIYQTRAPKRYKAGVYLPDFQLTHYLSHKTEHKNTILQGTTHHVLIFSGTKSKNTDDLIAHAKALMQQFGPIIKVHLILGCHQDSINKSLNLWIDKDHEAHHLFGLKKPSLMLIRPDKYIGAIQSPIHITQWINKLYFIKPDANP